MSMGSPETYINHFKIRKKILIIFLFALLSEGLLSQPEGDGFLGLDVSLSWHGGSSRVEDESTANNTWGINLALIGASDSYKITTYLHFLSNLIYAGDQFDGSSSYLQEGEVDYFSYFFLNIQYNMWSNEYFSALLGYGLGHFGYISHEFVKNPYTLFVSPIGSLWWFISQRFALLSEAELPISIIRRNTEAHRHVRFKSEVVFVPKGDISNPPPDTVFLVLGWRFDYISITTKDGQKESQITMFRPYFRFTYLY